jgi:hypothetical protein
MIALHFYMWGKGKSRGGFVVSGHSNGEIPCMRMIGSPLNMLPINIKTC